MASIPPWRKSPSPAQRAQPQPSAEAKPDTPGVLPAPGPSTPGDGSRDDGGQALLEHAGRHRLFDDDVDAAFLATMSVEVAAQHIMLRLARRKGQMARAALLREVTELLLGLPEERFLKRVLLGLADAGRIIDIYPLELFFEVKERAPDRLPFARFSPFVKNRVELEATTFELGEAIRIQIPLAMRLRAFALEGGGFPGYALCPGPPAEYELELFEPGEFWVLLRGEVRKEHLLDRIRLKVADSTEGSA